MADLVQLARLDATLKVRRRLKEISEKIGKSDPALVAEVSALRRELADVARGLSAIRIPDAPDLSGLNARLDGLFAQYESVARRVPAERVVERVVERPPGKWAYAAETLEPGDTLTTAGRLVGLRVFAAERKDGSFSVSGGPEVTVRESTGVDWTVRGAVRDARVRCHAGVLDVVAELEQ